MDVTKSWVKASYTPALSHRSMTEEQLTHLVKVVYMETHAGVRDLLHLPFGVHPAPAWAGIHFLRMRT